jgi:O-antigen/teichoic acid export membrane protein
MNSDDTNNANSAMPTADASLESSAKRGLFALAISNGLQQIVTWALTLLTIRLLLPSDYGLMALIESLSPYFAIIASFDLASWIIQKKGLDAKDEEAALTHGIILGLLACLLLICIAPLASRFYQSEELYVPLLFVGATFLFRGLGAAGEGKLKRDLRFREIARVQLFVSVVRGVIQLVLAYMGFGFWALVSGFFFAEVVRSISWLRLSRIPLVLRIDKELSKDALKFGLPSAGASLLWTLYSSSDNLFVGRVFGAELLGLYSMGYYLVDLPAAKINQIVRPVLIPFYSKLKENLDELRSSFLRTARGTTAVLYPCVAGMGIIAYDFVPLLLDDSWSGLETALVIMSLSGVLRVTTENISPLFLSLGLARYAFYCNFFAALVFPTLVIVLGLAFGMPGVYASWFVFLPLRIAVNLFYLNKALEITAGDFLRAVAPSFIATLLMIFVGFGFSLGLLSEWHPLYALVATILACIVVYSSTLRVFFGPRFFQMCISFGIDSK